MKLTIWEYKGKEYEKTKELDMCERSTGERNSPSRVSNSNER